MHTIKVSIVIPVYNASPHLEQCIHSVLTQTLQEIEVIIVNDGSTDDSLTIIRKFEKQEDRVVVIDSPNEGVSAARNKGLEIARGDYIGFVDADDWVEPEMFDTLYERAVLSQADIAICNVNLIKENAAKQARLVLEDGVVDIETNRETGIIDLMRFKYDYANWNKIYSTSLIRRYSLFFSSSLNMYEDLLFNLSIWQYSKKGVVIDNCLYNYRMHPGSVMHHDRFNSTEEYNKLFVEFTSNCDKNGWDETLTRFQKEMRRGYYYTHLPKIISDVKLHKVSILQKCTMLESQLKKISPGFFLYGKDEMKGLQSIKKHLLKRGRFSLISIISLIKNS